MEGDQGENPRRRGSKEKGAIKAKGDKVQKFR